MQAAHLRDFIAVADQGSLRAAARHLDLSQGAISKNLMALEKELGVSLLVRSAHGVEPTEQGRILLRRARLADAEMRKAREELAALAGKRLGTVQVGLSCTAEALIGAEAIRRFRGDFPDSSVYTRGGTPWTLLHLLREGKLDFAVTNVDGPALGPDLQAQRLFSTDYVVVARADHPLAGATSLSELGGCEWIQGSLPDEFEPSMETAFRKAGLPQPRVAAQRDAFSALSSSCCSPTTWPWPPRPPWRRCAAPVCSSASRWPKTWAFPCSRCWCRPRARWGRMPRPWRTRSAASRAAFAGKNFEKAFQPGCALVTRLCALPIMARFHLPLSYD